MTRLTKQMEKLDAMLSDVKLTNYKERATQIADFLEKYIPDVAAMETQMKKYEKCFTTAESEKKALKKKNAELSEALKKSQQEGTLKKIQEARLQSDYKQARAILDHIPPEIIWAYTQRSSMKKEVSNITHWNNDEWNGFADLLANLIEKYAAVLDIDNLPKPPSCDSTENETVNDSDKNFTDSCIDSKKIA